MTTIRLPTALRPYADDKQCVTAAGRTVREALQDLTRQFPDLTPHLFNDNKLREIIHVFAGEDDLRYVNDLEMPIPESDRLRIMIIPPVIGG
jgi:molybdopterin synthase sulfur carrier subunit